MSARSVEDRQSAGQFYITAPELQDRLGVTAGGAQRMAEAVGQPVERPSLADLAALVVGRFTPDLVQRDVVLAGQKADA